MKNKIPTAEEFYLSSIFTDNVKKDAQHPFWALNNELTIKTVELMKEFAIFHVKAALEAAAANAKISHYEFKEDWMVEFAILNAYPKENIK